MAMTYMKWSRAPSMSSSEKVSLASGNTLVYTYRVNLSSASYSDKGHASVAREPWSIACAAVDLAVDLRTGSLEAYVLQYVAQR